MRGSRRVLAALMMAGALFAADPVAAENVLRFIGADATAGTLDPHSSVDKDHKAATRQVYEALLDLDSDLAIVPQLASAWHIVDPTHWVFELRQDVAFHDGTPFTAGDVVFSIGRAGAQTSDFKSYVAGIAKVEAIDDHTVRFTTAGPDPSLWVKLAEVAIMSKAWAERHDVITPADYIGAGEETFASRHANGTGPFVVEAFEPRGPWTVVRSPGWWGQADQPHNIDRVVHVTKGKDDKNVAALLDGEIDLLQTPPYSALDKIRGSPGLKLVQRPKLHTMFFGLDQSVGELRSSNIKGRNPFKDKRVREAMARALDMGSALRDLMGESFIPAGMIAAPGVNGYAAELDQPTPRDPDKAKALLIEAGYPEGFRVTLDCANDWGDDEITTCTGAAEQLMEVGIEVDIDFATTDELEEKVYSARQSDFYIAGYHMDPDSERALRELFHSRSHWNLVGYGNPRVDELIEKIATEMLTYARDAYLEEAWTIVTEDFVYLPIRHGVSVFALREELEIPPDPWDVPRFRLARFLTPQAR